MNLILINQSTGAQTPLATNLSGSVNSLGFYLPKTGDTVRPGEVPVVRAGTYRIRMIVCPKDYYPAAGDNRCYSESPNFTIGEPTSFGRIGATLIGAVAQAVANLFGF